MWKAIHTPRTPGYAPGIWGSIKGFVHAHVGWLFRLKGMERGEHYGKDLYDDPLIRRIDRLYFAVGRADLRDPVR